MDLNYGDTTFSNWASYGFTVYFSLVFLLDVFLNLVPELNHIQFL